MVRVPGPVSLQYPRIRQIITSEPDNAVLGARMARMLLSRRRVATKTRIDG
jgi:hypothetical protein